MEEETPTEPQKSEMSPIEEARQLNESLQKNISQLQEERKKIEALHAHALLSGTSGTTQEPVQKPETKEQYTRRIEKEIQEGKYN